MAGGSQINSRRLMQDPFAPPSVNTMRGRVADRQSNLSPYDRPSVSEDPSSPYDIVERRYSQMPHPSMMVPPHMQQRTRGFDGRIQGGSRQTYQRHGGDGGGQTFVETDGRPLDVEMEVWEGPNNTPTRVKMYSEDGRQRPMNILTNNMNGGGGTTSVRNVGSMEFPIRAGVGGGGGGYGAMDSYGYGAPVRSMGSDMMAPSGMRPHGSNNPYGGYGGDRSPRPSMARGETVQGGSLKTFTLPSHVNAAQVTITSDGLPVNAKVELWGTSSHIKQLAEVYNDNGQTRPFAAIIDVPGGENTIAVRNTGPLEYPIRVVVEPVGGGGGGMDDMMMPGGYGYGGPPPPMGMMGGGPPMGGPPMGGRYLPPPPF